MEEGKADVEPQVPSSGDAKFDDKAVAEKPATEATQPEKLVEEKRQDEPKLADDSNKTEENKANTSDVNTNDGHEKLGDESKLNEREDFDHEEANQNWHEYRIVGKAPRRRGYHAAFVYNNWFYIHGGHDIREGSLEKMYRLDLTPQSTENSWELIQPRGMDKPGKIGFHTMTRYENKAYLIGGSDLGIDNEKMYEFDIESNEWTVVRPTGTDIPDTRDEHSANIYGDTIVVFGGNVGGFKNNETWQYYIKENKWTKLDTKNTTPERSNHGASIIGDELFIFGGKDMAQLKLNDLWKLNLKTGQWTELEQNGDKPIERSGCSLVPHKNFIVLFGGIFELTKELGD
jgi:N-acetylneuraminic acid mutarotase